MAEGRLAQIAFVLLLFLTWVCYQPAIDGSFQLDDRSNLQDLSRVSDFDSGVNFALSGSAGPLGRPLALATFAMQAAAWDDGAAGFLRVNILIHLLNGVLLAFCVFRLSISQSFGRGQAMTNATLVAGIWLLLPLLATASLLVVQRMATLSATFMLLGLAGYLMARSRIDDAPQKALLWMSLSLGGGTLLAILCKESGLLLPVYVLVLEATILRTPDGMQRKLWRTWQALFLGTPLLFIVVYLASSLPYSETLELRRGFTGAERLMTEAGLLWVYLYKAVIGNANTLGVFQDAPGIAHSVWHWKTLLACSSWLVLGIGAIVYRRRWPLLSLAVLWYLAGHSIESTFIALELYFEHRNYLPIFGPIFALSSFLLLQDRRIRLAGIGVAVMFMVLSAYSTFVFASLWGEPSMASRHWAMRYPDSVRAVATMASYQLAEEGPVRAIKTLDAFTTRNPEHGYLRIQQLNLLCRIAPDGDHRTVTEQLRQQLPSVDFTYTAGTMLSQLSDGVRASNCESPDMDTVVDLAEVLRSNPRYVTDSTYNQFHQKLLASIARQRGDHESVLVHLESAINYRPSAELNFMMVTTLVDIGQFAAAREFMDEARQAAPANPLRAAKWHRDLDELVVYVDEMEKVRQ